MNIQRSIDEFSEAERNRYHTGLIDLEKLTVAAIIAGRDKEGLKIDLQAISDRRCPTLFIVDIWKGNINKICEVCPETVIVADKFHIIWMVNQALGYTWRVLQRQAQKGKKKVIFRTKRLFLKTYERLLPLFKDVTLLDDAMDYCGVGVTWLSNVSLNLFLDRGA